MLHLCDVRMTERPSLMTLRMQSHRKRRALGSIPVVGSSYEKENVIKSNLQKTEGNNLISPHVVRVEEKKCRYVNKLVEKYNGQ